MYIATYVCTKLLQIVSKDCMCSMYVMCCSGVEEWLLLSTEVFNSMWTFSLFINFTKPVNIYTL